jgi:hypothetical protein
MAAIRSEVNNASRKPAQAEPVEALPFFNLGGKEGQPFDKLRVSG